MSKHRKIKSRKTGTLSDGEQKAGTKKIVEKENGPWFCKSVEKVYENNWISVSHHEVLTPGATEGVYGVCPFS